jgi:hypothetical protein
MRKISDVWENSEPMTSARGSVGVFAKVVLSVDVMTTVTNRNL